MDFKNKFFGAMVLLMAGGLLVLETGFSGAQTPVAAQTPNEPADSIQPTATIAGFNAAGYEATPRPKPVHKKWKLSIPEKVTPNLTPMMTMVPAVTAAPTPSTH